VRSPALKAIPGCRTRDPSALGASSVLRSVTLKSLAWASTRSKRRASGSACGQPYDPTGVARRARRIVRIGSSSAAGLGHLVYRTRTARKSPCGGVRDQGSRSATIPGWHRAQLFGPPQLAEPQASSADFILSVRNTRPFSMIRSSYASATAVSASASHRRTPMCRRLIVPMTDGAAAQWGHGRPLKTIVLRHPRVRGT